MTGFDSKRQMAQAKLQEEMQAFYAKRQAAQAALAQPEQEPCIGKDPRCPCQDGDACHYKDCVGTKARPVAQRTWVGLTYKRPWQGLTDEDWVKIEDMPDAFDQGVAWAAARLKERNNG